MSTLHERDEKRCLNCNSLVYGRYCQVCGQENVHHKMSFFGMFRHFVFDLLHFDGKFFSTIFNLYKKPGFVALEYINGKRVKYLEPFKMYIFTSTIFFLALPYLNKSDVQNKVSKPDTPTATINYGADTSRRDSLPTPMYYATYEGFEKVFLQNGRNKLGWLEKLILHRVYTFGKEHKVTNTNLQEEMAKDVLKKIPKVLFFILPVFTWLLQLLYFRKKELTFSDQGIFTLYYFVTIFISIILVKIIAVISDNILHTEITEGITFLCVCFLLVHLLLALKRFYQQKWGKTILKFTLFFFFGILIIAFAMLIIFLISFLFF
jgi:hypothetical protein